MGWLFSNQSRHELIQELIRSVDHDKGTRRVIAHALRGNVLWSVVELTAKADGVYPDLASGQTMRYIACDLLERNGQQWGYKGMEESMHPYYYTCPLSYLAMADESCPEWRSLVRAYHAQRRKPVSVSLATA